MSHPGSSLADPGHPVSPVSVGGWCNLGDAGAAEIMGRAGFDWIGLDAQHGLAGPHELHRAVRSLSAVLEVPVLVRVASQDGAGIGAALDAGAAGIIVPTVESAEAAAAVVRAASYPPVGVRSIGTAAGVLGRSAPSPTPAIHVMVETATGLREVDAISRVEGLSGIFVGPHDLAASLGTEPGVLLGGTGPDEPLPRVAAACAAAGITAGVFAGDPALVQGLGERGFTLVAAAVDSALLQAAAADAVARSRRPAALG